MRLKITWHPTSAMPAGPPDPLFPRGRNWEWSDGAAESCWTPLPYPAAGAGVHLVECPRCGVRAACAATGRADDPRTVRIACERPMPPIAG